MKNNACRQFGIALVAAVVIGLMLLSSVSSAQQAQQKRGKQRRPATTGEQKTPMMQPGGGNMFKTQMEQLETMSKVKSLLAEAKGAAEAEGGKTAVAKIDEALKLIEERHITIHQEMDQMHEKMRERMKNMRQMMDEMQKMQESSGQSEETKPMQGKMGQMRDMMQKMHQQMRQEGMMGRTAQGMKCPMCGKPMVAVEKTPKIVNSCCPIEGTKLEADKVSAEMTCEFKGQKIGFCCLGCLTAWDKLTDEEKEAKLQEAMK